MSPETFQKQTTQQSEGVVFNVPRIQVGLVLLLLRLPGSSKRRKKEELLGKPFKRPQHELDPNGLVPLPVKVCFSCSRFVHERVHTDDVRVNLTQ